MFQASKIFVWCSQISDWLKMFLKPNLNVDVGFYYDIHSFWEYIVVTLSKLLTGSKRAWQNFTEQVIWIRDNWCQKFKGPLTKT